MRLPPFPHRAACSLRMKCRGFIPTGFFLVQRCLLVQNRQRRSSKEIGRAHEETLALQYSERRAARQIVTWTSPTWRVAMLCHFQLARSTLLSLSK